MSYLQGHWNFKTNPLIIATPLCGSHPTTFPICRRVKTAKLGGVRHQISPVSKRSTTSIVAGGMVPQGPGVDFRKDWSQHPPQNQSLSSDKLSTKSVTGRHNRSAMFPLSRKLLLTNVPVRPRLDSFSVSRSSKPQKGTKTKPEALL